MSVALKLLLRYWKPLLALLLIASALGYTYHKGRRAAEDRASAAQARQEAAALRQELAAANAALAAAEAARGRNDTVIPEVRRGTAERIARADRANAAERLRDDREAVANYARAAGRVRGKSTD